MQFWKAVRVGLIFNGICERHASVRLYVRLVSKLAPAKYRRLLELRAAYGRYLAWLS